MREGERERAQYAQYAVDFSRPLLTTTAVRKGTAERKGGRAVEVTLDFGRMVKKALQQAGYVDCSEKKGQRESERDVGDRVRGKREREKKRLAKRKEKRIVMSGS